MELRNEAFHLLRQLFQQHTARWQQALPDLTKPQYAVMRCLTVPFRRAMRSMTSFSAA